VEKGVGRPVRGGMGTGESGVATGREKRGRRISWVNHKKKANVEKTLQKGVKITPCKYFQGCSRTSQGRENTAERE